MQRLVCPLAPTRAGARRSRASAEEALNLPVHPFFSFWLIVSCNGTSLFLCCLVCPMYLYCLFVLFADQMKHTSRIHTPVLVVFAPVL
jgi:hypothetical protein